jgi:hypothetical protein
MFLYFLSVGWIPLSTNYTFLVAAGKFVWVITLVSCYIDGGGVFCTF